MLVIVPDSYHLVPVILLLDSAVEGVSSSSSTKDIGSASPLTDRKKHRRKKSMNQKGDANTGQADGKHEEIISLQQGVNTILTILIWKMIKQVIVIIDNLTLNWINCNLYHILSFSLWHFLSPHAAKRKMWKLKSFGSLRNVSKTGNADLSLCIF